MERGGTFVEWRRELFFSLSYHEQAWLSVLKLFLTAEEIDLSKDIHDWNNRMNENERFFYFQSSAFSPLLTVLLMKTIENFSTEVQIPEAKSFYGFNCD